MNKLYNTTLDQIEKEISEFLPANCNEDWIYRAVGGFKTKISPEDTDYINEPALELINRGGKRWRPLVMVLTTAAFSKNRETSLKLSPFVELIHNGTLLIDDIEDKSIERRGKKAIHLIYGEDMAINSGNHLYFIPTTIIDNLDIEDSLKLRIYQSYTHNMRRLHFGQGLDIQWHADLNRIPTVEQYIQMCKFKTGCLASMSGELGAIIGNCDTEQTEHIRVIWENIGVAFQIMDDIKNITTGIPGKHRGDDIVEGKKSLPVILHCNKNISSELLFNMNKAKELGIDKGNLNVEAAIKIMESSGSIKEASDMAQTILKESLNGLNEYYPESIEKSILLELVNNFLS